MNHAITLGEILGFVGVVGGCIILGAIILFILAILNPFGSGH